LKNKKGAKQQKFIQIVEKQVKSGGQHNLLQANPKKDEKEKKLKEAKVKPQRNLIKKNTDLYHSLCTLGTSCSVQTCPGSKARTGYDISANESLYI
jgi:hypothetical protein